MPKKKFSSEQIIAKLRQIQVQLAQGKSIAFTCKQAVSRIQEKYGLSERHACRLVSQPRGTQRAVWLPADHRLAEYWLLVDCHSLRALSVEAARL
ncbi:hypothetical protein DC522_23065 [Microvirga sp. KLBC 81]|nr:hypothetical protein DC522_23065 [Microvirga sp. KLBC 81]